MPVIKTSMKGPKVQLSLAWTDGGQRRQMSAAEALFNSKTQTDGAAIEWIYTGSFSSRDGSQFAADLTGALIGFIHDPTTLIESASTIGIGAYGSVRGNPAPPPVGTSVELIVEAASAGMVIAARTRSAYLGIRPSGGGTRKSKSTPRSAWVADCRNSRR